MSAFEDLDDLGRAVAAGRRFGDLSDRLHREVEAAIDPREVLRRVCQQLTSTIADACEIDIVATDGSVHRLVAGSDDEIASRRERARLPIDDEEHPIVAVLRTGEPRLIDVDRPGEAHLFGPPDDPTSARALGMRSAILTRLEARGQVLGALSVARGPSGRRWVDDDVDAVVDIARRVAGAYHNALLLDGERRLTAFLTTLQRITADLAATRSVAEVTSIVLAEALPRLGADAGGVALLGDDGLDLEPVAHSGLKTDGRAYGRIPVHLHLPVTDAVRDVRVIEVADRAELGSRWPDQLPAFQAEWLEAAAWVPLVGRRGVIGVLSVAFRRPRRLDDGERGLLVAIAGQCAQAIERARADDSERHVSRTLQNQMLADASVVHPRLTVSTRYVAAASGLDVGGDWYDVVALPGGQVAFAVGDVVGSGVEAAATMGQLRSALKALALRLGDPAAVLEALDRFAADTSGAPGATVCYGTIDPDTGAVRLSLAGHPPPLVIDGDGARFVDSAADPPLGVRPAPRRSSDLALGPGSAILLYTDGLVERRGRSITEGLDRLAAAAADARGQPPEAMNSAVLAGVVGDDALADDVALLLVRLDVPSETRFRTVVPADSAELRGLRHELRHWLDARSVVGEEADDIVLAMSEAATNSVEHAYDHRPPAHRQRVELTAELMSGAVFVEVRDAGRWKPVPSDTSRGRGLAMARAVMGDVSIHHGPSGTVVSMRRQLAVDS